ncbi:MAG: glycine zipper 2TM domain-containing protein [Sedimenticola sp.]|nr:glycine zipper 2TM domain-containing protein [Sedimenticola sp.]MCW9021579.1 glycine zipper 2TM domain-containing protein [Sedimenticola sp.]
MKTHQLILGIFIVATTLLSGCANTGYQPVSSSSSSNAYSTTQFGVVDGIESVPGDNGGIAGTGVGAGTIIGGVIGGVLGHQVGGGTGKDIATAAGVVGGAVVGHELDKRNQQKTDSYNIRVRLNNGGTQTINVDSANDLRIGDRVRIDNGQISRY